MFKQVRIAILLYVLAFVAVADYLASTRTTDWDATLWVDVYPINASGSARVEEYIAGLADVDFDAIERFLAREAGRHDIGLTEPFRIGLAEPIQAEIPELAADASMIDALLWSLRMRWFATRVRIRSERPGPDIQLFAVFHDESQVAILDRSAALERGLIAVANVFASTAAKGSNQVVMAHELLHTLGASDKYVLGTNLPMFPQGYANPSARPLHPQRKAELMAGRIPIDADTAEIPGNLDEVLVGPETALEIGWLRLD